MSELLRAGLLLIVGGLAISSALFAIRVLTGDRLAYERNRRLSGSFGRVLKGGIPTMNNGSRNYRVAAGIAINTKTGAWVEQGRLSAEAVEAALRSPQ